MTTLLDLPVAFELPDELIATAPIEASGRRRDETRLLVAHRSDVGLVDARLADLAGFLRPGDVLVVNTSATLPAAVPIDDGRRLHLSTELPGGLWVVELRTPCGTGSRPYFDARPGETVRLPGGGRVDLLAPFPSGRGGPARLWTASLDLPTRLTDYLGEHGRPIRYGCGDDAWPLSAYQTVFAKEPGSAEMPSAARGFTRRLVTDLVTAGVVIAPISLHTGVSSLETGEPPYPERYEVPATTAELVNAGRAGGHRVVAVGTTVVRALETVADDRGLAHPGRGWTELVITPSRGVRVVDAMITGWHEPNGSHLDLVAAVAGTELVERAYAHALAHGYLWHEFGDLLLVLPEVAARMGTSQSAVARQEGGEADMRLSTLERYAAAGHDVSWRGPVAAGRPGGQSPATP